MPEADLRDTFGNFLVEIGKKNSKIVVLDVDLSASTKTSKFAKAFPNRFFNVGIAEQNMLGIAMGLAISEKIPVVSGFSIFTIGRAWEFIRFVCHDNLNVKIITTHGGIVGKDGSTHNALEDLSLMSSLPNLNVLVPSDNIELNEILTYVFKSKGPFYVRLPRGSFPNIHKNNYKFIFADPDVLKQGTDLCLIGTGYGSFLALNSAAIIEKELNISTKVINLPCIKPINEKSLLTEIKSIKTIIVIEEHNVYCGVGSILARIISEHNPKIIKSIGVNDAFCESGNREDILNSYGLNEKTILEKVKKMINN